MSTTPGSHTAASEVSPQSSMLPSAATHTHPPTHNRPPNNRAPTAEAVIKLLDAPAYARELGERGQRRVETELTWTVLAKRILEAAQ